MNAATKLKTIEKSLVFAGHFEETGAPRSESNQ